MMTLRIAVGAFLASATLAACGGSGGGSDADAPDARAAAADSVVVREVAGGVVAPPDDTTPRDRNALRRVVVHGVDLTGVGYDRGSMDAPVVLVNFSDFGCPYCAKFAQETEPTIDEEYVKTGKVFVKYVPFVMGMFPNGGPAARAAECAGDQGKFKAMHDRLYAGQREWKRSADPASLFQAYAAELKLDRNAFAACHARPGMHARTIRANEAAENLGVRATPSFAIDDRGIEGAPPLPQFRELLDAALAGRLR